ncbi:MAG: NifU family protein [Candidatus Wallbacteria bacterium]
MKDRVKAAIDKIRPMLNADGGDIELVDVVDNVVKVKLTGACHGCPAAAYTLQMGVEKTIKKEIPEIIRVENVG